MIEQTGDGWHMDKTVNISHIVVTVLLLVSAITYSNSLDKRIAANEQDIVHIKEQRNEDIKRIDKHFDTVNSKLDRLLAK